MKKRRILLIDDEPNFSLAVRRMLSLRGFFEIEIAINGKKGLAIAKKFKPDLILLDFLMPGMDGLDVLEKLKSSPKTNSIPVIILSGTDDDQIRLKASALYNEDYLLKTTSPDDLAEKVLSTLNRNSEV